MTTENGARVLRIGKGEDGFTLPLELVTSTQAILARKRSGKSYTASVQAEELLDAGQQIAVIDPTGAWWGLRSTSDGEREGYGVVVFGGRHADAPLDYTTGTGMAAALVEHGFSAIFDLKGMTPKEQMQFVHDFTAEMLRINRYPIHLFIDEADTFAPQKTGSAIQFECLGAMTRLVSQGGIDGLGVTMITQRSAKMNWDVLSQVNVLTVLRMGSPNDIKPVVDWLKTEVSETFAAEVRAALPSLPKGTAFIASADFDIGERVEVRARRTYDSGATPKPGERRAEPKVLAAVDIARLGKEIAASVEKVKAESPEFLQRRVAELEAKLKDAEHRTGVVDMGFIEEAQAQQAELERVRTDRDDLVAQALKTEARLAEAEAARERAAEKLRCNRRAIDDIRATLTMLVDQYEALAEVEDSDGDAEARVVPDGLAVAEEKARWEAGDQLHPAPPRTAAIKPIKPIPQIPDLKPISATDVDAAQSGPAQRILAALAKFRGIGVNAPSKMHVCLFAGYGNMNSKGFSNAISGLRTAGLVDYPGDGAVTLTAEGLRRAPAVTRVRGNEELHARIFEVLNGPEARLLRPLLKVYPRTVTKDALMTAAGYGNANSKGFSNSLSRLRTMGFVEYPGRGEVAATAQCFIAGQR